MERILIPDLLELKMLFLNLFFSCIIIYLYSRKIVYLCKQTFYSIIAEFMNSLSYCFVVYVCHLSYLRYCVSIISKKLQFLSCTLSLDMHPNENVIYFSLYLQCIYGEYILPRQNRVNIYQTNHM